MKNAKTKMRIKAKIVARDGDRCFYCGLPMEDPTIEHVLAISRGGKDSITNLVLAHQQCNEFVGAMGVLEKIKVRDAFRSPKHRKTMIKAMQLSQLNQ